MRLLTGNIEEAVLTSLLREGALPTKELVEKVSKKHACTKQGVYRVLRKLKSEEKVVMYKSIVSINNFWREQLQSLLTLNTRVSIVGDLRGLKEGDRLSLKLRGLSIADQVWSHLFISIEKELLRHHPLFLYNPHNWSAILREETDRVHAQRFEQNQRPAYLVVGSIGKLDKMVTRAMEFKYLEYSFSPRLHFPFYVAVISDYVFQMKLLGEGNAKIDAIFISEQDVPAAKNLLAKLDNQVVCRVIVEKDPIKATLWKKRLGKDFYIPKKYIDF